MNCPRCNHEEIFEDQRFCMICGWEVSKPMPNHPADDKEITKQCYKCGKEIPIGVKINVCPFCGEYLGFNREILNPDLVGMAKGWGKETSYGFIIHILGLDKRIARALSIYAQLSPIEVLALRSGGLRQFAEGSYQKLDEARNNWVKKY